MFKPLSLSFFANPGVSTRCVPLVARIVMNLSLWAAPMISGMSSRSRGSPPEKRMAGGLGLALAYELQHVYEVLLWLVRNRLPCSGKVEKQTAHLKLQRFVTSITPMTVPEACLVQVSQT